MQHPLQAAGAPGDSGVATPVPGPPALADQPTVHEFFTQLVTSAEARSAFDADPRAALSHAGLGDLTPTDVLHATSLVLDYAPVEVIEAYNLSLHSSVAKFAASTQQIAIDTLHPAHSQQQEATDHSMMESKPPADHFSKSGDVDKSMNMNVQVNQQDSHNGIDIHNINIASGNQVDISSMAANASSAVSSVTESVDHSVNVANSLIHDIGGGLPTGTDVIAQVEATVGQLVPAPSTLPIAGVAVASVAGIADTVTHGDPSSALSGLPVVGAVAGAVTGVVGGDLPAGGDVTGALSNVPVVGSVAGAVTGALPHLPVVGDLTGALPNVSSLPAVGAVTEHVSAVTEHLTSTVHSLPVVGEVAHAVPLPDVHSIPVVGDVASSVVSDVHALPVVGDLTSALPLDHGL